MKPGQHCENQPDTLAQELALKVSNLRKKHRESINLVATMEGSISLSEDSRARNHSDIFPKTTGLHIRHHSWQHA